MIYNRPTLAELSGQARRNGAAQPTAAPSKVAIIVAESEK
jgi:hypothetical protein